LNQLFNESLFHDGSVEQIRRALILGEPRCATPIEELFKAPPAKATKQRLGKEEGEGRANKVVKVVKLGAV